MRSLSQLTRKMTLFCLRARTTILYFFVLGLYYAIRRRIFFHSILSFFTLTTTSTTTKSVWTNQIASTKSMTTQSSTRKQSKNDFCVSNTKNRKWLPNWRNTALVVPYEFSSCSVFSIEEIKYEWSLSSANHRWKSVFCSSINIVKYSVHFNSLIV